MSAAKSSTKIRHNSYGTPTQGTSGLMFSSNISNTNRNASPAVVLLENKNTIPQV